MADRDLSRYRIMDSYIVKRERELNATITISLDWKSLQRPITNTELPLPIESMSLLDLKGVRITFLNKYALNPT